MEKMKLGPDDAIHYIVRIRTADETPIAISYTYLSQKYMSSVDLRKIEGSVYQIMQENGAQFKYSDGEMTAVMPTRRRKTPAENQGCGVIAQYYLDVRPG